MTDDSSNSRWLSTHPHPPVASSSTGAVLAQLTAYGAGMPTGTLQHAHPGRSEEHSRSNRKIATPIQSLYSSRSPLTNASMHSHQSRSSTFRRFLSPLVHPSISTSSGSNASAAESYTHMPGYLRQPSPGIPPQLASNYPVASFHSTSASHPSIGDSVHNAPSALSLRPMRKNGSISSDVILADSLYASLTTTGQVQRVYVKRLMSKPAILSPSSIPSHSILSVPAHRDSPKTHASASSSLSDDETADRRASIHPLNVGRRRRSRTMDELMLTTAMSIPIRPPQVHLATSPTITPTTTTVLQPHQAAGPSFTNVESTTTTLKSPTMAETGRPQEAINTSASTDYHMQRTTVWLDTPSHAAVQPARQTASLDLHRTDDLTPASALVLAWNRSQRRKPQPSPDSPSPQLSPPPPPPAETLPPLPSQHMNDAHTRSYGPDSHAAPSSLFDSSTRGGKVTAVSRPEEEKEDPYRVWAMVEERLRETARTPTGGNPIKELRRRVTGRFSRGKDKKRKREEKKEKEKEKEKRSESIGFSAYPAASSRPSMPQRQKIEHGTNRQPAGDLVIPQPRGSSLTALSSTMSRKSWGDVTNASNHTEFGSYKSQVTPTSSAIDVNHNEYPYSPHPAVPGSESSQTPAAPVRMQSKSLALSRTVTGPGEGDAGRLWKLVRKLSNGALRQRFANQQGGSSFAAVDIPSVPALPKDFELVDHHAYVAERNREHAQEKTSWFGQQNPGSFGTQPILTPQFPSMPSSKIEQPPIPGLPTSPPSTSPVSPPLSTMPTLHAHHIVANINALSPYLYPPKSRRTGGTPAHNSLQSTTTSGDTASIAGHDSSFLSNSPGFSSSMASDMTSSKVMTSPYSRRSSASSNSELNATDVAVAVARPIMPPDELFRIRQEEYSTRQAQSNAGHVGASSGRVQPGGPRIHSKHNNKAPVVNELWLRSPVSPPPPSSSPVTAQPLPAPPRRQTLANVQLEQARAPPPTEQALLRAKGMQHPPISRPLSSPPGPPLIPSTTNDRPTKLFDGDPISQDITLRQSSFIARSSSSTGGSLSPRSRLGSLSSINVLSPPPARRRFAKTINSVHPASLIAQHIEGNIANLTPSARKSFPGLHDHIPEAEPEKTSEKSQKLWLNTSNSLLSKVRSRSAKSSSALQSPESSGTDSSPTTDKTVPARLVYKDKQRERSKSFVELGRSRTPPVPFTATAFAFRELNPGSPVVTPVLTEQEREGRWAALLARSDRAGGTLTAKLEGVLLSDTMSTAED